MDVCPETFVWILHVVPAQSVEDWILKRHMTCDSHYYPCEILPRDKQTHGTKNLFNLNRDYYKNLVSFVK